MFEDTASALFGVDGLQLTAVEAGAGRRYQGAGAQLVSLASSVSRWEDEITAAVITGITDATNESLNHLAKLDARLAYGFRNPLNKRRRVRIARIRG